MNKNGTVKFLLLTSMILGGWFLSSSKSFAEKPLNVYVANYPMFYFAERVGGDSVKVIFPAPGDGDPAFWKPGAEAILAYQKADIILLNGATYEKWIKTATLPEDKIVDTSKSFKDQFIKIKDHTTHSHGPGGEHSHAGTAFTTWLDFTQAVQQAKTIKEAFVKLKPAQGKKFGENFLALEKDLMELDQKISKISSDSQGVSLVASHPVYQYFKRRYNLNVVEVMWEPETYPEEKSWQELEQQHGKSKFTFMIWEGEPLQKSVDKLNEMGIKSLVFDPSGNRPGEGKDFLDVMNENIKSLQMISGK